MNPNPRWLIVGLLLVAAVTVGRSWLWPFQETTTCVVYELEGPQVPESAVLLTPRGGHGPGVLLLMQGHDMWAVYNDAVPMLNSVLGEATPHISGGEVLLWEVPDRTRRRLIWALRSVRLGGCEFGGVSYLQQVAGGYEINLRGTPAEWLLQHGGDVGVCGNTSTGVLVFLGGHADPWMRIDPTAVSCDPAKG